MPHCTEGPRRKVPCAALRHSKPHAHTHVHTSMDNYPQAEPVSTADRMTARQSDIKTRRKILDGRCSGKDVQASAFSRPSLDNRGTVGMAPKDRCMKWVTLSTQNGQHISRIKNTDCIQLIQQMCLPHMRKSGLSTHHLITYMIREGCVHQQNDPCPPDIDHTC